MFPLLKASELMHSPQKSMKYRDFVLSGPRKTFSTIPITESKMSALSNYILINKM